MADTEFIQLISKISKCCSETYSALYKTLTCPLRWSVNSNPKFTVPCIYSTVLFAMHLDEEAFKDILVVLYHHEENFFFK